MILFYCVPPAAPAPAYNPGYVPQSPPPQQYYPQPTYPAYAPAPAPMPQQQSTTNVVVVGQQAPQQTTTIIQQKAKPRVNHVLHLLITIFLFPPWIFVWIILCMIYGC